MLVGASTIVTVGTTNNGTFQAPVVSLGTVNAPQAVAGNTTWINYSGQFTYTGVTGVSNIGFEALNGTTSGNLLDNIQVDLAPFVEFTQASSSTPESSTNNIPTLRVNGTVYTAFTVTVQITGGTAILGTDYTTPGNSTTLTINVPAGNYDGVSSASLLPLPVTIVNDSLVESNENILFNVLPSGGAIPSYQLFSSITCGSLGQTTWDYTIIDDDQGINIVKNSSAAVAVSGQPTQFDVTYTIFVS